MQKLRQRLTYSNVVATIALFLALGGTAAAFTIGKNSVKSKNIAKGAVKTSDIHNHAVSKAKLKADAISSNAIADGSIGAKQVGNVVLRRTVVPLADDSVTRSTSVFCKPGEKATGGGGTVYASGPDIALEASNAVNSNGSVPLEGEVFDGWKVAGHNLSGTNGATFLEADVVCLQ